jgi:signal transduction histidine kinase
MKRDSLALRIVIGVVGLDLLLAALLVGLGVFVARSQFLSGFDIGLRSKAMSLRALVRYAEDDTGDLIFDPSGLPSSSDPDHPDRFAVYTENGQLLAHSNSWTGLPANTRYSAGEYARFHEAGVPFRALVLRNIEILDREDEGGPPAKITVVYAASLLEVRHRVISVGFYLGAAGILLLALVGWLTVWIVRRGLSPLHELAEQAGEISVRHWNFQAPKPAKSLRELAPLTQALETLVQRLRDAFASQRQFTGDLAHELKTSVAIIKSSLQVLLQNPRGAEEYRRGAAAVLEDCDRLESLVERMLRLARVEQLDDDDGTRAKLPLIDVLATCEAAASRVAVLAGRKNVSLELAGAAAAQFRANPEDLETVWINLLDNAVRHSPAGATVTMRIRSGNSGITLAIEDAGEGIAPEDLPHIFERFHRGDNDYAMNFGLGLAICKTIVEAYGGRIEIASALGRGTTVNVHFPPVEAGPAPALVTAPA